MGQHKMVVSYEILDEYMRVGSEFSKQYSDTDFERLLSLILSASLLVEATPGASQICADPDDDKFIHCALSAETHYIISGDRHLLDISGYAGIQVLRPREFVEKYIKEKDFFPVMQNEHADRMKKNI